MNREQLVMILRNLSAIEGALMMEGAKYNSIFEAFLDPLVEMIVEELEKESEK